MPYREYCYIYNIFTTKIINNLPAKFYCEYIMLKIVLSYNKYN